MIKKKQIGQKLADKEIKGIYSGAAASCGDACLPGCNCKKAEAWGSVNTHLNTWNGIFLTHPQG